MAMSRSIVRGERTLYIAVKSTRRPQSTPSNAPYRLVFPQMPRFLKLSDGGPIATEPKKGVFGEQSRGVVSPAYNAWGRRSAPHPEDYVPTPAVSPLSRS